MITTTIILAISFLILFFVSKRKIKELEVKITEKETEFQKERGVIRADAKKRSGAVQWGKSIEHFVPFMDKFPVPVEDCNS